MFPKREYCLLLDGFGRERLLNMENHTTRNQKCIRILFVAYMLVLIYLVFFAESMGRADRGTGGYAYNLELFREIRRFYVYREQLGMKAVVLNLAGNVLAFVPFGFMLPVVIRRRKCCFDVCLLSGLLSFCIEITQLAFKVGSFDVDDILLNTAGGILGYISYRAVQAVRIRRKLRAG